MVEYVRASLVLSGKNPPAKQESRVPSLGQEDPLEKEMATHSSMPACGIPWTEEPGGLQSMGSRRVGYDWANKTSEPDPYYVGTFSKRQKSINSERKLWSSAAA